jgi:hypothetical protein
MLARRSLAPHYLHASELERVGQAECLLVDKIQHTILSRAFLVLAVRILAI